MKLKNRYTCVKHLELTQIDGEWLIMDTDHFTITKVNGVGAEIIEALQEQKNAVEIVSHLQETYGIHEQTAITDVVTFLEDLRKVGLVIYE
jgi:hypothetical protein